MITWAEVKRVGLTLWSYLFVLEKKHKHASTWYETWLPALTVFLKKGNVCSYIGLHQDLNKQSSKQNPRHKQLYQWPLLRRQKRYSVREVWKQTYIHLTPFPCPQSYKLRLPGISWSLLFLLSFHNNSICCTQTVLINAWQLVFPWAYSWTEAWWGFIT